MNTKTEVLGCKTDIIAPKYAIEMAKNALDNGKNFQIVTINPEMIMYAQKHKDFQDILNNSDLNIIDAVGVRIALLFQGISCHRIRGVDFARSLINFANENALAIGFLGAKEDVIQKTKEKLNQEYPDLNIVYLRNGYFDNEDEIIEEIKQSAPRVLLVGLGSPKQELIIQKLKETLNSCVMIGVGGSFDVLSGYTKESPVIFRKLGLEWLYRTLMQPERIKRIFPTLPIFLIKCIISSIKKGK
ncbi:WecB/TagA/CpsF family glycosyltransferase [bacterium]|nr:WecB/TagA/CpsF family glycosyltransferase [bacterium]